MAYRNDILICGLPNNFHNKPGLENSPTHFYAFTGFNFMTAFGLSPGDVVGIKQGPNGEDTLDHIDFGLAILNGITFINDPGNTKQIKIGWFGLGNNCYNIKFLGNGKTGMQYGFKLFDTTHPGLAWNCVGDLEVGNFEIDGALIGVQIHNIQGTTYPVNYQNFYGHDILCRNTLHEAFYLGYVGLSQFPTNYHCKNITIQNAGWDGIQTRNSGTVLVEDCYLDGIGTALHEGDEHGVLFGTNSNGGTVKNCTIKNVKGVGIWNGGWGAFLYECNEIQADVFGIMSRSSFPEGDTQNTGIQSQTIKNNTITATAAIEAYYEANGKTISVDIQNNRTGGTINIGTGITKTLVNNGPSVVPVCSEQNFDLIADVAAVVIARQTIDFATAGLNALNTRIVYEVGSRMRSWKPGRQINAITQFQAGKAYYIVPAETMNKTSILAPPLDPPALP